MSLRRISLKDFVIVDAIEVDVDAGFTALTGETGAGKSILIDAVQIALGQRADAGVIRHGATRCDIVIELDSTPAVQSWLRENGLDADEGEAAPDTLLLRRQIDTQGRSKAWINGMPATMTQLRAIGDELVDIHGQHAWQSLDNAVIYANNIAAGLAQADPANASEYYTNRAAFVAEIVALKSDIDAMMAALPADKRTVVTPHDAFGYFAEAYDLTFEAPQGMSTESEVSAADVAALITQIRRESISAVFIESITDNRMMEQIANETGATIGGTLYSDALSGETGPASTYLDMMRHNATTLSDALGS